MAEASIFTLDEARGGVPVLARAVYDLLMRAGHEPALVYRAARAMSGLDRRHVLQSILTTRPVRPSQLNGMRAKSVVAYPMAPRFQYHTTRLARAAVRAPIAAVVSGSAHAGLPRALTRLPYVLYVATMYGDELRARADGGDEQANALLHGTDWPALESQERLVHERASVILAASPQTRDRIAACWPHVAGRLRHVFNPIDTGKFHPAGDPADPPYVLLAARILDSRKHASLLIRAFARIHPHHPGLRLVIAGDEPSPDTRALVQALGLEPVVRFAGHVDHTELLSLYRGATLFALPSRQEGLGIVVQEAMACGLPVVSTRCAGPESLVEHGMTGLLVPVDDEPGFAAAMLDLLGDPSRRRAMGRAARERSLRLFSREHVDAQLRNAFEETFGTVFTRRPSG